MIYLTVTVERTECAHVIAGSNEPMCGLSGFCVHQRSGPYFHTCSDPSANGPVEAPAIEDVSAFDWWEAL
jgi:hypothetical protein